MHECKARGRFRNEKITPMVGDIVEFELRDGYNSIEKIFPRKNFLKRPMVANIDSVVIVLSAGKPVADLMLCDKLLIQAEKNKVVPILVINKVDADAENAKKIAKQYVFYDTILTSANDSIGIEILKEKIDGKCVCLAGQSAVGKSSLINSLDEKFSLEVGGLSKKTARGKHTTRQAELLYVPECNAYVVDTPGFSMYEAELIKTEVAAYYPDFYSYAKGCRFTSCIHDKEPDCAIKTAVEAGTINKERYDRYLRIIHSLEGK